MLLFRDAALQEFERFEFSDWPHGSYATPTFTGSKPAGSIAAAWAVLRYLGEAGYLESTREAMDATVAIRAGIESVPELELLTPAVESNIVVFRSLDPGVDIMAVADRLEELGWFRGKVRDPVAIHQGVNPAHLPVAGRYVEDLRRAVDDVRGSRVGSHQPTY